MKTTRPIAYVEAVQTDFGDSFFTRLYFSNVPGEANVPPPLAHACTGCLRRLRFLSWGLGLRPPADFPV